MKNFIKINVIFLTIFAIFSSTSLAADRILPIPKPAVEEEVKKTTAKKKEIYPKKKPVTKKEIEQAQEVVESIDEEKEQSFIYPKKKPVIVQVQEKVDKPIHKSVTLSKTDFKIAIAAFESIEKKKWKTALKLSKKARDKTLYKLVNYLYLVKTSNAASFYDYSTFINTNPNYPRINRLKYLAEHKINLRTNSPISIIKWFDGKEPLSSFGKIKLGEIYVSQGDLEKGSK